MALMTEDGNFNVTAVTDIVATSGTQTNLTND